ncbi:MAG TPA: glycosyltransferase [Solirubrobacterales bacterium]|nr:glycosyltransferase [Solirubrobacterales bacterium]
MSPALSVILATHNRRPMLERCIQALERQTQDPSSFELVVGDDGSSDGTVEMLRGLSTDFALTALDLGKVGRAAARNAAIEAARGAICLVIDDDVIAEPELVAAHLEAHRERRIVGIGRLTQAPPDRPDWYSAQFTQTWNEHFDRLEGREVDWTACYAGNLSAPREALLEVGGFVERAAGEDLDIGYRLSRAGCAIRYLPRARALHDDRKSCARLVADSLRQGSRQLDLLADHPEMEAHLFGWFLATSRREVALRRAMLALRMPPRLLARLGRLLPGEGRRRIWFDFVSRYAFWLGTRSSVDRDRWERMTRGVPVLMYHAFGEREEGDRFVVSKRALNRQLLLLRLLRYRGIHFEDLVATLRERRLPLRRAVVITIDDGYLDNLEVAAELLRRHRFPATVYLVSAKLGGVNDWTREGALAGRPLLSWEQAGELEKHGIRLGAHTRTHPQLPTRDDDEVTGEVSGSREDLSTRLGAAITTFAYPYGLLDERAVDAVAEAGFAGACTVEPRLAGLQEDPLRVPRIEVRAEDSLFRFLLHLWLGAA